MKKYTRFFTGLMLVLTFAISIASVGAFGQQATTLEKIKEERVIKVGMAQTTPGSYIDVDTGEWTGITIELFRDLANKMDWELKIVETSWDTFQVALNNKKFDVFGSTTFYTPGRSKKVTYTTPLFYKGVGLVVNKKNEKFQNLQDVREVAKEETVKVGVRLGAVEESVIPKHFPNVELETYKTKTAPEIALGLKTGAIDIWAADEVMQYGFLQENDWAKQIGVAGAAPIGFVLRHDSYMLQNFLNSYIRKLRVSGEMVQYFKEFGQPVDTLYAPKFN